MATIDDRKIYTHGREWQTPQCRAAERAEIDQKVAEFLAEGSEITEIPAGLGKDSPANLWGAMGSLRLARKRG